MNNAIFNKTVTKLFAMLKKCFLPNLNTRSYLKLYSFKATMLCIITYFAYFYFLHNELLLEKMNTSETRNTTALFFLK